MGIEYLDEIVTEEQFVVPVSMRVNQEVRSLSDGEWGYIDDYAVWMDRKGLLWLDDRAPLIEEDDVGSGDEFGRVIKLRQGYVVDVSGYIEKVIELHDGITMHPEDYCEHERPGKSPVIEFITSKSQLEMFRALIKKLFDFDFPVIEEASEG